MSKSKEIQLSFLNKVKQALPVNLSMVDELAELLSTSNDSAYRRMRGETLLSIDEIALICRHFKVSFDTQSQADTGSVLFNYFKIEGKAENFALWLTGMRNNVKQIESVAGGNILYAADDVPIWHHFFDDRLTTFKIFYWLKSIVNAPSFADIKYDPALISAELIGIARETLEAYNRVDSIEVWSEDTLNSTLKQVEYFWESGFFKTKEDAIAICDLIQDEIDLLQQRAIRESKLADGSVKNFKLYHSEVMIGNNSILVNLGQNKIAYVSNNTFNMMSTTNPEFVAENELWLKNLIRKSVLISGVSEKQRNQFFRILKGKIDTLRNNIQ
jgi:hypothetical protein